MYHFYLPWKAPVAFRLLNMSFINQMAPNYMCWLLEMLPNFEPCMSVMGFQKKSLDGEWVGGWVSSIQNFLGLLEIFWALFRQCNSHVIHHTHSLVQYLFFMQKSADSHCSHEYVSKNSSNSLRTTSATGGQTSRHIFDQNFVSGWHWLRFKFVSCTLFI